MKTVYDVQQLLKKFGTFVYTGERFGDLELMEMEIDTLYEFDFIQTKEFQMAKLILRKGKRDLSKNKRGSFI